MNDMATCSFTAKNVLRVCPTCCALAQPGWLPLELVLRKFDFDGKTSLNKVEIAATSLPFFLPFCAGRKGQDCSHSILHLSSQN